jgi:hypothetical protein
MSKRVTNTKRSGRNIRGVQGFVALGFMIGLVFIIAGGLLGNNENRDSSTAQLRTTPTASTTGSR